MTRFGHRKPFLSMEFTLRSKLSIYTDRRRVLCFSTRF